MDLRHQQQNMTLNLSTMGPKDNRFYDTGRQTLISQVASPHKNKLVLLQGGNLIS
jgi:hypothetical protein